MGIWDKVRNMTIGAAMAENPAVMTASGWRYNNGEYTLDQLNSPLVRKLRENISSISEISPTHPLGFTLYGFGKGILYGLQKLPLVLKLLVHPTWKKIYHGTPFNFTWKEARNYSKSNIGLHVSPNKRVADSFNSGSATMLGYAPKPKVETIDINYNNYELLSPNYRFSARPKSGGDYYNVVLPDTKRLLMLEKAGAKPSIKLRSRSIRNGDLYLLNTENTVNLDLLKLLKLSKRGKDKANQLLQRQGQLTDELLNKEASDLLSKEERKTIKYNNVNSSEGGGGESWILTDPSIVWNPTWKPIDVNLDFRKITPIIPLRNDD